MIDPERLKILTDSAKFDVSCSSSGSDRRNRRGGTGNASYAGICHSFTAVRLPAENSDEQQMLL